MQTANHFIDLFFRSTFCFIFSIIEVLQIHQLFHSDIAQTQCPLTSADSSLTQICLLI